MVATSIYLFKDFSHMAPTQFQLEHFSNLFSIIRTASQAIPVNQSQPNNEWAFMQLVVIRHESMQV